MLKSDIVHFASHYVIDEQSPMRSKLLLAREDKTRGDLRASDGMLQAHEIYRLKLPRTRVVVLSACQTGAERYYQGEGMINMARPFMAAGVPLVVVSLWPVDSDSTADLMISFHKHRKREDVSTAEALRRAQLEMLHSSEERLRRPSCWAPFIAIGGSANY
jgi:CHAT domain-containing protein